MAQDKGVCEPDLREGPGVCASWGLCLLGQLCSLPHLAYVPRISATLGQERTSSDPVYAGNPRGSQPRSDCSPRNRVR